jgi:hypothetical protein
MRAIDVDVRLDLAHALVLIDESQADAAAYKRHRLVPPQRAGDANDNDSPPSSPGSCGDGALAHIVLDRALALLSPSLASTDAGHIRGTSARDLPKSVENCRDLSLRPDGLAGASAKVRNTLAQDPAYRPAHPLVPVHIPGQAARALRAGANLAPDRAVGKRTWEEFLADRI